MKFEFYIEMACNGLFGNGTDTISPPKDRLFTIKMADLVVPNLDAFGLLYDFQVIRGMANELQEKSTIRDNALYAANSIVMYVCHCLSYIFSDMFVLQSAFFLVFAQTSRYASFFAAKNR